MNKYAVYDDLGEWIQDVHADTEADAIVAVAGGKTAKLVADQR